MREEDRKSGGEISSCRFISTSGETFIFLSFRTVHPYLRAGPTYSNYKISAGAAVWMFHHVLWRWGEVMLCAFRAGHGISFMLVGNEGRGHIGTSPIALIHCNG